MKIILNRHAIPILEFDDNPVAKLNPSAFVEGPLSSDKMVITFFPEVINRLIEENAVVPERVINGENPVHIY